jgi:hypothetical protein
MFPSAGNRAAVFTLVSADLEPGFSGGMKHGALLWKKDRLPEMEETERLRSAYAILIYSPVGRKQVKNR